jgi:hypothetical protein
MNALAKISTETVLQKKIQIDFAEGQIEEMNKIMAQCGISTRKELFNTAFSLLRWMVQETSNGNEIASVNKNAEVYRVLVMNIFQAIRENTKVPASGGDDMPSHAPQKSGRA